MAVDRVSPQKHDDCFETVETRTLRRLSQSVIRLYLWIRIALWTKMKQSDLLYRHCWFFLARTGGSTHWRHWRIWTCFTWKRQQRWNNNEKRFRQIQSECYQSAFARQRARTVTSRLVNLKDGIWHNLTKRRFFRFRTRCSANSSILAMHFMNWHWHFFIDMNYVFWTFFPLGCPVSPLHIHLIVSLCLDVTYWHMGFVVMVLVSLSSNFIFGLTWGGWSLTTSMISEGLFCVWRKIFQCSILISRLSHTGWIFLSLAKNVCTYSQRDEHTEETESKDLFWRTNRSCDSRWRTNGLILYTYHIAIICIKR